MPDYGAAGLLAGMGNLSQGINQGLITYQNMQNIQHQQKMQEAMTGLQQNSDGSFTPTAAKQQQMQLQQMTEQRQLHEMDPNSQESQTSRTVNRGLLQTIPGFKGDVNQLIPDTSSAADLKESSPIEKASMTGMYGMLGNQARGNAMAGPREESVEFQKHNTATKAVADDSVTKNLQGGYQSMQNALVEFKNNPSPQSFHTLQNVLRMNAGSSNRSGVDERAGQYASSLGIKVDEAAQMITGNMSDVNLSDPKMVDAQMKVAQGELGQKQMQAAQQIHKKANAYMGVYNKPSMQDYKKDFDNTVSDQYAQFDLGPDGRPAHSGTGLMNQGAAPGAAAASAPKEGDTKVYGMPPVTYKVVNGHWVAQ